MAKVLFAWELGGGYGHCWRMLPIAESLEQQGHSVQFAVRDVVSASRVLVRYRDKIVQAPVDHAAARRKRPLAISYAHLLHNCGFDCPDGLRARISAWRLLIAQSGCDAMIFDHSPTALAATHGSDMPRVVVGTGFTCPPSSDPMPRLLPVVSEQESDSVHVEDNVLQNLHCALGVQRPSRLSDLYHSCNEVVLRTFSDLDPFDRPSGTRYWGPIDRSKGNCFTWPKGRGGKRIFAYLKRSAHLPKVLRYLSQAPHSSVVFGDWATKEVQQKYQSPSLQLSDRMLDTNQASEECDIALLNGTHASTARFLLTGSPVAVIPLVLEQVLTAHRVAKMGAGTIVKRADRRSLSEAIERTMAPEFRRNAEHFASKNAVNLHERERELFSVISSAVA